LIPKTKLLSYWKRDKASKGETSGDWGKVPKTSFRPTFLLIAITLSVFVYLCIHYDVTQDDAFISFRYAANFLNGDGLVYNSGEQVEGYTNFLWIMLLVIFKQIFSIDFILTAKILGILFGAAIFLLAYLLIYRHSEKGHNLLFAAAGIMLISHLPLPYWSTSGLETSAFACIAFAALIAELRAPAYTPLPLFIATLLRPEGALLCMIIIINRMLRHQRLPMPRAASGSNILRADWNTRGISFPLLVFMG